MSRRLQVRRQVSPETRSLIAQLDVHRSWTWMGLEKVSVDEVLATIADRGEPAAVPWLLDELFARRRRVREAAAAAVAGLVRQVHVRDVAWFDDHVRRSCGLSWRRMSALHLSLTHRRAELLAVACCHPSGYVRETALRSLSLEALGGTTLLFLILRLNDWVSAVRDAADERFDEALSALPRDELIPALGMVPWMRSHRLRRKLGPQVDRLLAAFEEPGASDARERARRSEDPVVRREAFRLSLRCSVLATEEIARGLTDPDPSIAMEVLRGGMEVDGHSVCRQALRSPHGRVRAAAIRGVLQAGSEDAEALVLAFMFDPSPAVREVARSAAIDLSPDRILEAGRRAVEVSSGRKRAAALAGLTAADVPQADLRPLLNAYANDISARVRARVVECMAQLEGGLNEGRLLTALSDPSRRVASTAARLAAGDRSISAEGLWDSVTSGRWDHTRRHAFLLLSKQGKWVSLRYTLEALRLPDIELRGLAHYALRNWMARVNRSFVPPSETDRLAIEAAIDAARSRLGDEACRRIEFYL